MLNAFGVEKRLIGHGVFFSIFSGKLTSEQQNWLDNLKRLSLEFKFDHITEHFGFITGKDFHTGAPFSIPFNRTTLSIGKDRMKRIFNACQCPVGLENLAFSYSLEEVKRHGAFLGKVIEPVNGFIILDLHNLYCQLHNFDIKFEELLDSYPLEKVREIHISGGSWEESKMHPHRKVRRDTHDDIVPNEVFELLKQTIPLCPHLKFVVLEQLGIALDTVESRLLFQNDFYKMEAILQEYNKQSIEKEINYFMPSQDYCPGDPIEDKLLADQQLQLSKILLTAADANEAKTLLRASVLAHSDWEIDTWQPYMLETAIQITKKWQFGFD